MNIHEHELRVLNVHLETMLEARSLLRSWFEDPKFVGSNLVLASFFCSRYILSRDRKESR